MHARLIRFQAAPERIDAATRHTAEVLSPMLHEIEGFRGFLSLGDRSSGAALALTFWDSEETMHASVKALSQPRKDALDDAGVQAEPTIEPTRCSCGPDQLELSNPSWRRATRHSESGLPLAANLRTRRRVAADHRVLQRELIDARRELGPAADGKRAVDQKAVRSGRRRPGKREQAANGDDGDTEHVKPSCAWVSREATHAARPRLAAYEAAWRRPGVPDRARLPWPARCASGRTPGAREGHRQQSRVMKRRGPNRLMTAGAGGNPFPPVAPAPANH